MEAQVFGVKYNQTHPPMLYLISKLLNQYNTNAMQIFTIHYLKNMTIKKSVNIQYRSNFPLVFLIVN